MGWAISSPLLYYTKGCEDMDFRSLTIGSIWIDQCVEWINDHPEYNCFKSMRHKAMTINMVIAMKRYGSNFFEADHIAQMKIMKYVDKMYKTLMFEWSKCAYIFGPMDWTEYQICLIFASITYDTFYSKIGYPLYPPKDLDTTTKYWKDPNRMCALRSKIVWEN